MIIHLRHDEGSGQETTLLFGVALECSADHHLTL